MAIELAGGEPSQIVRAGDAAARRDKVVAYDPARCAALGRRRHARRTGSRRSSQRLGFAVDPRRTWRVAVPTLAARRRRRRRHRRGSHPHRRAIDKVPSTPLPRAPGVARPTATPEQMLERRARRAAAARGLNEAVTWSFISEAEAAPFGGAAWIARQPDQRGDEGDAPVAAARPARRGAAQRRRAARTASGCSRSAAAISGERASGRRSGLVLAGERGAARLADGQGRAASTPSTPRPRRWRCSPRPARRSTICR